MRDWKDVLFIRFCTRCALMICLNLTNQQLVRLYEECLVMAEYIEDRFSQMTMNVCLGALFQGTKQFTEAITYLERALVMASETNNTQIEAIAYGVIGLVYNALGKSNEGLSYVKESLAIAMRTNIKSLEGTAYRYLGIIYHSMGEYQTAINCHEKELAISQELNDKVNEGYAYYYLGETYWSLGMHEETKIWHKKCLLVIPFIDNKEVEENVNKRLSMIYHWSGKYDKAIRYSEKLLHLFKDNHNGEGEVWVYGHLGNVYKSLGKVDEAIEYYTKQLVLAETMDCQEDIKSAHANLGAVYNSMSKHLEAIKHFEKLLIISKNTGDEKEQAASYCLLGSSSLSVSNYYKAIEYYKESLNFALEPNSKHVEMTVYMGMGDAYSHLGKYHEAIGYQEKALSIAEEIDDKNSRGLIYGKLGAVFNELGEKDKVLKFHLESLSIARETGNKEHEWSSLLDLGAIYRQLGKFHESLQCYEKVLDLQREKGFRGPIQITYGNLGIAYESLGKWGDALKYHEKNLSICQERGDRGGEGTAYKNLSRIYEQQGKYQEAMFCSKTSLKIAQELGDRVGEADSLLSLGTDYLLRNKYDEALECIERSLVIAKEIGNKSKELGAYSSLGDLYIKCGKCKKAFDYHEKALTLAVSLGDKEAELSACHNLGYLYHIAAGNHEQCKKHLEQSLQCCEWMFDHLHDRDDCKVTIMDTFIETYKLLTSVLIETGEIHKALFVSDRGRARGLSDLLELKYSEGPQYGKNAIQKYDEVDSFLHSSKSEFCVLYFALPNEHAVAEWILVYQKPLVFYAVNAQGFANTQLLTSQCNDGSEIISEVVFAAYDAMNVRNCLSCEDRSLDHLPENVPKTGEYFVRAEGQKEGDSRTPDQNKRPLQDAAQDGEENAEGNKNPLEVLYTELIAPVMQNFTQGDVVIVPDGPLYMVPFAALRDPETGLFLSDMKRIRLVPSLTTLKNLQECPADYHSKTGALVVGDPDSGTVMFQGEETTFSPLPKARHEATVISNLLNVEPLIGVQATKDVIKQRLREGVAVIHIAAHGSTKGEIVLAPRALTGVRKIPEEEDYMLTMQEVQETGVKAQLVVLSCCHSGRGEIRAEGIVGISRGFLAAGARAVVASLWAIDDEATLEFMVSFYTYLKMGESASKSLQQAMKDVRDVYEEIRHWAPFFLIGDDVTINL